LGVEAAELQQKQQQHAIGDSCSIGNGDVLSKKEKILNKEEIEQELQDRNMRKRLVENANKLDANLNKEEIEQVVKR